MDRRDFTKSLGLAMAAMLIPITLKSQEYSGLTYDLKTQLPLELIQDLRAYNNLDVPEEIAKILDICLEKELGNSRGTITKYLYSNKDTFEITYKLQFTHDGQFGREELWGLRPIIKEMLG